MSEPGNEELTPEQRKLLKEWEKKAKKQPKVLSPKEADIWTEGILNVEEAQKNDEKNNPALNKPNGPKQQNKD